jgi:hypothetical protein
MKIGLGRYRLRITLKDRAGQDQADRAGTDDPIDRDISRLAQAEREYHDTIWKPGSLLDGTR